MSKQNMGQFWTNLDKYWNQYDGFHHIYRLYREKDLIAIVLIRSNLAIFLPNLLLYFTQSGIGMC